MRYDIDHAAEIALKKALHIGFDRRQSIVDVDVAESALMRGDDDIRHRPKRMIDRQRLLAEYVKRRAGDAFIVKRLDQRRLVDHATAREIDQITGRLHRSEYLGIDAVAGGRGERCQQDQKIEIADHLRKLFASMHAIE